MGNQRVQKLIAKKMIIEQEISRIKARENAEKRKEDNRRKIVAGAIFLKMAEMDPDVESKLAEAIGNLPERDRKLFLPEF